MNSTKEQGKLSHWLMSDVSNFRHGKPVGSTPSEYELYVTKKDIKKHYLKVRNYKPPKTSLEDFIEILSEFKDKSIGEELEVVKMEYVKSIQDFLLLDDNFSLALGLMSKEGYTKFIRFLFDFMQEHQIPFRSEIVELMQQQDDEYYLFQCLKHKVCYICGKVGTIHHVEQVGSKGYNSDFGQMRYTCACREHHSESHSDAREALRGIELNEYQLDILRNVYPNHFRGIINKLKLN